MKELLIIAIGSALVNNVVLSQFWDCVLSLVYPRKWIRQQVWAERLSLFLRCLLSAPV